MEELEGELEGESRVPRWSERESRVQRERGGERKGNLFGWIVCFVFVRRAVWI